MGIHVESQNKNYRLASYVTGLYQACFTDGWKACCICFYQQWLQAGEN